MSEGESKAHGQSSTPPGRRQFLAVSAMAGAGALLARNSPADKIRSPQAGPGNAAWASLQSKLSTHTLSRPGDSSYPLDRQLFDPRFNLHPAGIAYCGTAADVSTCLAFAQKYQLPFRIRAGGHSYGGWSSLNNGLVIDVSKINHFSVGNGTVTVGAGLDLINLYNQLAAHGLAVPGGSCPTVGLAGLALGGGIGVLSRQFGLTCDAVESVQLVAANGAVLNCGANTHSDLLWACQGGGGGNFGVATSFTLRTHELSSLVLFFLQWPWSKASQVISAWQSWAPNGPHELWSNLHLTGPFNGGSPVISAGGTWLGTVAGANRVIRSLIAQVGSQPSVSSVSQQSFLTAMLIEAGCGDRTVPQCDTVPGGELPRVPFFAKSDFFSKRLSPAAIQAAIQATENATTVSGPSGGVGAIAFDALGGAVNRVHPSATAFVHRDCLFDIQYSTSWTPPASSASVGRAHTWLRSAYADLHPHANGQAYQNYIDPDLANWRQAYYGANYPRLARIKKRYDPQNIFNFPQSITA